MGSNPTKSQKLLDMFENIQVIPELTSHPSNLYQLIFVDHGSEIFTIKESREPIIPSRHPNALDFLEEKNIDGFYFSKFQWVSLTLKEYLEISSSQINRAFALFLASACLSVYGSFWRENQGRHIDIRIENMKILRKKSGISLKVVPPALTKV